MLAPQHIERIEHALKFNDWADQQEEYIVISQLCADWREWQSQTAAKDQRIAELEAQLAGAKGFLKPVLETPSGDDYEDALHTCGVCGHPLQLVRPGKYQCNYCE